MFDSVERASTTATGLNIEQDKGIISKTQFAAALNEPSSIGTNSGSGPRRQETVGDATTQTRVLALETTKTNQALEIRSLKRKVKNLEKKKDASKQGRIINNLDADEGVTLVNETQGRNDQDMFDTGVLDDEEVMTEKEVSTANPVTTVSKVVTTAGVEVSAAATTPTISMDDITLAKELVALKSAKPMVKKPSVPVSAASTSPKVSAVSSETRVEGSSKRVGEELEYDKSKKQKLDEKVEALVDDDKKEAEMKMYMKIVPIDEVAIDAIPLANKPLIIVDWKIIKEGKISSYHIIRADGSSKRPEEAYERVLWGDLKVMFKPNIESEVWRKLQGNKVTV
nr:hypothetical protein [Tanacetum cinerariifolium]